MPCDFEIREFRNCWHESTCSDSREFSSLYFQVGDGYVTLKTDQLPHAWSRETTEAGDGREGRNGRPSSAEHRRGSPGSPQGQPARSSNPTPGQNKRFNSPDFKLPPTGQSSNMTGAPPVGGCDASHYSSRGNKGGKSVRISSGNNRVYNGTQAHSLDSQYWIKRTLQDIGTNLKNYQWMCKIKINYH